MHWIMQMVWFAVLLVGIVFVLWIGLWLFVALFALGAVMMLWGHLHAYLLRKGILNPTPGVPMDEEVKTTTTVIEGDFIRVDTKDDDQH